MVAKIFDKGYNRGMRKLPIGIQTLRELIERNYLYVDKTKDIYHLFGSGGKYYFLSRPRRFGKSLLISTLKEIFSGNKELFKGLWIYDKIEWETFPVIHIDFSRLNYKTPERLEETLGRLMDDIARSYGISLDPRRYYNEKFDELIVKLSAKGKVVILIDEYDRPIIDRIDDMKTAGANRDILKEFYGILKPADEYLRFVFITGVSKFSRVSVFSGLNNLEDITIDDHYATMLGYTQEDLLIYFSDRLKEMEKNSIKREALAADIKNWYNGYSWDGKNFVYNPFSVLSFFKKGQFGNYWFASGTPSFLVKLLRERKKDLREYERYPVGDYVLESYEIENLETTSLLFQTGYLTIKEKSIDRSGNIEYILAYPNKEVRDSFIRHLFSGYTGKELAEGDNIIRQLTAALKAEQFDHFFEIVKSLFASISYNIFIEEREAYYHSIMYMIFRLMEVAVQTEVQTNTGRIDAAVETDEQIMIFEFKIGTADEALEQIKEKKYFEKFLSSSKKITLIGIGFNIDERNISDYSTILLERG
jgi:hypothetical protein